MFRRFMRILVLFDLPVKERELRKEYSRFHKFLEKDGYDMLQFSVYCRICNGLDGVEKHMLRLRKNLPPEGSVRAMVVTERQFEKMKILVGTKTLQEQRVPAGQMILF